MRNPLAKYQRKIVSDLGCLEARILKWRKSGKTLVVVSGTWDLLHNGHNRYTAKAKSYGQILIVGCDSDEKVRARKGPHRPIVSEDERAEMLSYLEAVNCIYIKRHDDPRWALIRTVQPDVLIISKRSEYSEAELEELKQYCGEVVVLESQAETSTTARIRILIIKSVTPLLEKVEEIHRQLLDITGGGA